MDKTIHSLLMHPVYINIPLGGGRDMPNGGRVLELVIPQPWQNSKVTATVSTVGHADFSKAHVGLFPYHNR